MGASFFKKIQVLFETIKIIKNWHLYVALYYNLVKSKIVVLETRSGIKVQLRVNSTDIMVFTNVWLLREYNKPGFDIKNEDVIIDIGSHIGLFALFASQFCKSGKIFCFEPVKENFDLLKSNLVLNNIKNVTAINAAVSANTGNVIIYLNDDESGHSMHVIGHKQIQVKSFSLKEIIDSNHLEKCNFLKIDCEGEEYEIIKTLPSQYIDKIDKMCIEYHFVDKKPHLLENLIKKLRSSYIIKTRKVLPDIGFLYANR